MNETTIEKRTIRRSHLLPKVMGAIAAVAIVFFATPVQAHALFNVVEDVGNFLNDTICGWMVDGSTGLLDGYSQFVAALGDSTGMTGSFANLFSSPEIWNFVNHAHQTVVIPVAESILALFMLVQLVKISQRIDSTSTLPAVKEIVFLAFTYVLFHWLITHSLDLVTAIYDIFNDIAKAFVPSAKYPKPFGDIGEIEGATIPGCVTLLLMSLVAWITGLAATIVSTVVVLARAVQLYAMAAFSPIPLSLMGFDETRQMGIGFVKNFSASALAGAIMLFVIAAYPYMVTSASLGTADIASIAQGGFDGVAVVVDWVAMGFLLVFSLFKCGGWAKEVLGG